MADRKANPYVNSLRAALGQGAGMGWGDEAEALARAKLGQGSYESNLANIGQEYSQYKKEHPYLSSGLELAGGIPAMLIPGFGEAKAVQLASQIGMQGGLGAIGGAGYANPGERVAGAKEGAMWGAGIGAAIPAAGKLYKEGRGLFMNPEARLAEKVTGNKFDYRGGMKQQSSPERQEWIGKAHDVGASAFDNNNQAYKDAIFKAYQKQHPKMVRQSGATNYDELLKASYQQLGKETGKQFQAIPNKMDWWGPEQYAQKDYLARAKQMGMSPAELMRQELRQGQPMAVYKDVSNPHPYLSDIDPATGANQNELFRAVHDYFGHLGPKKPNTFGPRGEENAWAAHNQMYSDLAKPAMTAETRGQNSWVNYVSPENKALRAQGKPTEQFAQNKPVLLPPEALDPRYKGGLPDYLKGIIE